MKTAADAPRSNMFLMFPEELVLITDKTHPLYDPRVEQALEDRFVKNIHANGVKEPVLVRKVGDKFEVFDGRQRTRAAVEVNKILFAEGGEKRRIRVIIERVDDASAYDAGIYLNHIRKEETDPLACAEKASILMQKHGKSQKEVAITFGVTEVTIRNWMALLDLPGEARNAVRSGRITATDAVKHLKDKPAEGIGNEIAKLEKSSAKRRTSEAGTANKVGKKSSPIARLRRLYRDEKAMEELTKREKALVNWFFGETTAGDLAGTIPGLSSFLKK